jgi:hypothetical protein
MTPAQGMPTWLQTIADGNPVSAVTTAVRDLPRVVHNQDGKAQPFARLARRQLQRCLVAVVAVHDDKAARTMANQSGAASGPTARLRRVVGDGRTGRSAASSGRRTYRSRAPRPSPVHVLDR